MHYFAKNLKYLRRQKGLSQQELAAGLGLNRGNIASYEKQSAEPSMANLNRIGKFFKIELSELIEKDLSEKSKMISSLAAGQEEDKYVEKAAEEILFESLEDNQEKIEKFRRRSDEMARILDGFRQFHKFRMENAGGLSDDVKKLALDYEKLLDVLEDVMVTNRHMMKLLESNSNS